MQKNSFRSAAVRAEEVPAPECGRGHVLIANRHSLISAGTETAAVGGSRRDMVVKAIKDPDIRQSVVDMLVDDGLKKTADRVQTEMTKWTPLGYSGAGVAVEVGRDVDGIRPGDMVAYGGEGHAEFVRARKQLCARIPEGVSTREAAFVAVGSIALQGVRRAEVQVGETVAVLGMGLVGQLVSQLLQASGARVIGTDRIGKRLELAERLGLEQAFSADDKTSAKILEYTGGLGVDRVMICASTKSREVIEQAVAISRDRGRIVVVGAVNLDVPWEAFYMKELDLVVSRSYGPGRYDPRYEEHGQDYPIGYVRWTERRNMQEFLRLIQAGKVNAAALVSHEFGVDDAGRGYDLLMNEPADCLGVLLKYDHVAALPQRVTPAVNGKPVGRPTRRGNVAVFGCGAFARQYHLPGVKQNPDLHFRTLVSSSGQSAKEMAGRYGAERCTTSADEVWNDSQVDAVMILTRDKSHAPLTAAALRASKHVFCEKPLATSHAECDMLAELADGLDLVCMTGFNRRFSPLMQQLKPIVDECRGPKMIHYRVNAGALPQGNWIYDREHAEGRLVGEACHFVDLFRWLIGAEPVRVSAQLLGEARDFTRIEDVSATFEFPDGSLATLLYTARGSSLLGKERMEIFSSGAAIVLDDYKQLTVRGPQRIDVKHRRADKGHAQELEHFVRAIRGEEPPAISLHDGLQATRWCLKLREAARDGEPLEAENNPAE